jgi:N-acetylglutamate synthase-like GNAT family acetyltransferase
MDTKGQDTTSRPRQDLTIRKATPEDADGVFALIVATFTGFMEQIGAAPGPMRADYAAVIREDEVWIVDGNRGPMACVVLVRKEDHLLVEGLAVRATAQRTGVGGVLLDFAATRCADMGLPELRTYANIAITDIPKILGRMGWEEMYRVLEEGFERAYFRKDVPPRQGLDDAT